jgi:hypothetical protein
LVDTPININLLNIINKGVFCLVQITKTQMDWLITNGYLKIHKGKYQNMVVVNKQKKSSYKRRYVSEDIAKFLNM